MLEPEEREPAMWTPSRRDEHGRWIPWRRDADGKPIPCNTLPPVPEWKPRRPGLQPRLATPWCDDGRDSLEVLALLAGGTTFRLPATGGGSRTLTVEDVAHALGHVRDPLQQRLARALACQTISEWPTVQVLAHPPLLEHLTGYHATRALVLGANRFRARLVAHQAFHDLALLRMPNLHEAARKTRMRAGDYAELYAAVCGQLESWAREGAATACRALFS